MLQGLTQCETIDAGKLREAAEMKNDENILIHIKIRTVWQLKCAIIIRATRTILVFFLSRTLTK
jgi:hypothetical protein